MKRLREEVANVMVESSQPTRELVRRMHFLSCVIKESEFEPYGFEID